MSFHLPNPVVFALYNTFHLQNHYRKLTEDPFDHRKSGYLHFMYMNGYNSIMCRLMYEEISPGRRGEAEADGGNFRVHYTDLKHATKLPF